MVFKRKTMAKKCLIMICRSSSAKICNREWILPLNDDSELPGKFYREQIPLASIIVSRTWKLKFTSKRISRYGPGLGLGGVVFVQVLNKNQFSCLLREVLSQSVPHLQAASFCW